jgi:hypothetical protein
VRVVVARLGIWIFGLIWHLGFGIWNFASVTGKQTKRIVCNLTNESAGLRMEKSF